MSKFVAETAAEGGEFIYPMIEYIVITLNSPNVLLISLCSNTGLQHCQSVIVQMHPSGVIIENERYSASEETN